MGDLPKLTEYLKNKTEIAVSFSGGVDSTLLLYMASKFCKNIIAYYVESEFQPKFERDLVETFCKKYDIPLKFLKTSVMNHPDILSNGPDRCYLCKKLIFSIITDAATSNGFKTVVDGTNASDDSKERPGIKALAESAIESPLRMFDFKKIEIRQMAKEYGLDVWNLPSYSCLATRIYTGTEINQSLIERIERSETILKKMGFVDFRIRTSGKKHALLQMTSEDLEKAEKMKDIIETNLSEEFDGVSLDSIPRLPV